MERKNNESRKKRNEIECPGCGGKSFYQEVSEYYYRYIEIMDNELEISYEDDYERDLDYGEIICQNCGRNCTELFDEIEIDC